MSVEILDLAAMALTAVFFALLYYCLLYTSDAADEL